MTPLLAAQAPRAGSPEVRTGDRKFSPVVFALDRLFPKRGGAPYATAERLVVLVIIRAMSLDGGSERSTAF